MNYQEIIDEIGKLNLNPDHPNPNHHTKLVNFFYKLHISNQLDLTEVRKANDILTNIYGKSVQSDIDNIAYFVSLIRL